MYIFDVDDGVNSGNGRLCQSSIETSLDLLEQYFHTGASYCEYVFGCRFRVGVEDAKIQRILISP